MSSHQRSFGRPVKDMGVNHISADHITSKLIHSVEHIDQNVVEIEKDIYDLQDIAYHGAEESLNTLQEVATVQNDLIELQFVQSLPWFTKANFQYGEVTQASWNTASIPESANQLFVRYIDLEDTFTGMILIIPSMNTVGEARHVSIHPKNNEAVVYISTNPAESIRLTSFDVEWFPPSRLNESDRFVGHAALFSKPNKMNGFLFGSTSESSIVMGTNVVFPNSGPYYIQSLHLDNNQGHSRIVLVGQKFQSCVSKYLGDFVYYGIQ
jgi:hypothetical protein